MMGICRGLTYMIYDYCHCLWSFVGRVAPSYLELSILVHSKTKLREANAFQALKTSRSINVIKIIIRFFVVIIIGRHHRTSASDAAEIQIVYRIGSHPLPRLRRTVGANRSFAVLRQYAFLSAPTSWGNSQSPITSP